MGPKSGNPIGGLDLVASITGNQRCQAIKVLKYTGIGHQGAKSEECLVMAIGRFTVSTRDASGLSNPAVWVALARKGLARTDGPI